MAENAPATCYRFREFELDVAAYRLTRERVPVRLERRPMELLILLLQNSGRLVTRDEIVKRLWPQGVVIDFDTGLNTLVSKIRHALGDLPERAEYVETVPGKGYRFIAPVSNADRTAQRRPVTARILPLAAAGLLLLLGVAGALYWRSSGRGDSPPPAAAQEIADDLPSIAVLPFADLSEEQDQQYFSDGLADELLSLLAQSRELRVIARTSSFSFREKDVDIATVAEKLNVTHVLEGSVRKAGDRVRITVQLIDASNSAHLWAQTYDRQEGDLIEIQSDIATSVSKALQLALAEGGRDRQLPQDAAAYDHFLRAQFYRQRRDVGDLQRAQSAYERALGIEPGFARAWAKIARVHQIRALSGEVPFADGMQDARDAAERALHIDPRLAEAHLALATALDWQGEPEAARDHGRTAARLEPDNPLVLSYAAGAEANAGRFDAAADLQRRALRTDPLSGVLRDSVAWWLYYGGRLDEAEAEWLTVSEFSPMKTVPGLCFVRVLQERYAESVALAESWPDGEDATQCLALAYHGLGRTAEADTALENLVRLSGERDPRRVAEVHAFRGEPDDAFRWLEVAVDNQRARKQTMQGIWKTRMSPLLGPLHADARWQAWHDSAGNVSPF